MYGLLSSCDCRYCFTDDTRPCRKQAILDGVKRACRLKQDYKHLIKRLRERVQISDIMESVVGAFSIASSLILYVIGGYLVCTERDP